MGNPLTDYLLGPSGCKSSTRLMSFMALCAAIFFGSIVVSGKSGNDGASVVMWFLIAAFGGNVGNKIVEKTKCSTNNTE